ncbi:MAG TPA: shikimate dehydrogenase [Acidimicrobiales bacterium]
MIGDPVRHSLSPVLHNAAFSALGLDWVYLAFAVPPDEVAAALGGVRSLGIDGLSVTMPHKAAVAALVDRLSPAAEQLGAVNTVVRRGGRLDGETTDGEGLLAALRFDEGWDAAGRRCLLLGTGGAARAVALALGRAGASRLLVAGRRLEMAAATALLAGAAGEIGTVEQADNVDIIINATPVGMAGVAGLAETSGQPVGDLDAARRRFHSADPAVSTQGGDPGGSHRPGEVEAPHPPALPLDLDPGRLGPDQLVVDLVYAPAVTPLLEAARARGATAVNGLGMLIHQAALQFRLWTGEEPPLEVMSAAALSALTRG